MELKAKDSIPSPMGQEWPAYRVERKLIAWLKPYERNARTHSDAQIGQLQASLRQFGWTVPVLAREDGTIIAGHGRVEAAKREGLTECPVVVATGWTEQQCRAYALADNRIALNSGWDLEILGLEAADLSGLGVDLAELGFGLDELADLTGQGGAGNTDPDDVPEVPVVPVSRVGDLWILGKHRLLCGDSTRKEDVERLLAGVKPHLMVTDPPYGVNYDPTWRDAAGQFGEAVMRGKVEGDNRADWGPAWALFPGTVAYVWCASLNNDIVIASLEAEGFKRRSLIIWVKPHFQFSRGDYHWMHEPCWYVVKKGNPGAWVGDRKQTTVWQIAGMNPAGRNRDVGNEKSSHGTQKPVECMKRPIENNSSPGQAVYDPFVGSGTTIVAGEMTGRSILAIEIDPVYVDVAVVRWQEFTGQVAVDETGRAFADVAAERVKAAA